jgi:flagellar assembly factor FliW
MTRAEASPGLPGVDLEFIEPIPGLEPLRRFTLRPVEDCPELFTLRSVDTPQTRLFLLDPSAFFPEYRPEVDDELLARLAPEGSAPVVLVVLRPGSEGAPHTANLLAPVLVNATAGTAVQAVLDADWPLRAPLVPLAA